jgi:hypothetical protein
MAALETHLFLEHLPAHVRRGELSGNVENKPALALGLPELDSVLPDGGFPTGAVVELAVSGGSSLATSLALAACRSAQEEATRIGGQVPWCAIVDPSATLYGPGIASLGVDLERLLVVRPSPEALGRTAIRLAESNAFSVIVIDSMGVPGAALDVALGAWPRIVRRLAMSAEESGACVILVTDGEARRPLPLPVAIRLELMRPAEDRISVRIGKERRGRISSPHTLQWSHWPRPRAKALSLATDTQQQVSSRWRVKKPLHDES